MKIRLEIGGVPVPKARPKFSRSRAYKTDEQSAAEDRFVLEAKNQLSRRGHVEPIPAGRPLLVSCWFVMPIPKSRPKKFKARCTRETVYHTSRPDTDNLIKFVADCLNGIGWRDDSQVAVVKGMKIYGQRPRTVVVIETLEAAA